MPDTRLFKFHAWLWAVLAWPIAGSVAAVLLVMPGGTWNARSLTACVVGSVLAVVLTFALPQLIAKPNRLRPIDRSRMIFRLRFRNGRYTEAIASMYDGGVPGTAPVQHGIGGFPVLPTAQA